MTEELEDFLPNRGKGENDKSSFIDKTARIIGDVEIGSKVGLWPGAVIKGSESSVKIGEESTIMNGSFIQGTKKNPTNIDKKTFISSGARLKGCNIGEGALVGIDAVVLEGVNVGKKSIVGTNAIVPEGMEIPERSLVLGQPAEVVRDVTDEELQKIEEIKSHLSHKREEFKIMMDRGEEFNVFDTPKRPEEILSEHEELNSEELKDITDIEKTKQESDDDLLY